MTQDAKTTEEVQTEQQSQSTDTKTEHTVPSYRLKEEADKRRTAENKLAEYEKAEQERKDADLSESEKLRKQLAATTEELTNFKATTTKNALNGQFTQAVMEAGLPAKIAKVAIPSDLSDDNMKDMVKAAVKEFAEFMPKADEPTKKVNNSNPFMGVQPTPDSVKKIITGNADAVQKEFFDHIQGGQ